MEIQFTSEQEARYRGALREGIAQGDRQEFVKEEEMDARIEWDA
jgi:hypothetical protein